MQPVGERLRAHLARIYGEATGAAVAPRLIDMVQRFRRDHPDIAAGRSPLFDETDVVLITYGDQVREPGRAPLDSLRRFLADHLGDVVTGVHVLPPYPATSDDGFAVADYTAIDPEVGTWDDIRRLARERRLMLDAVVNHTSASHSWFRGWLTDEPRYADYYLAPDPSADLRSVVRPRTSPLLSPFTTASGQTRQVWTTFSADQVDLNYANPEVLLAVTDVLLRYLAEGARMLRLDAVAFLWKRPGTSCLHLPETHEIVRLWRTVMDAAAPGTLLITETNVPHRENVTYFGSGDDEAHLVYQFALPPLTLAAFHQRTATKLAEWARTLSTPSPRTTFLNFLASHDGIGLRPVEGMLDDTELRALATAVEARGGRVSYRSGAGGEPNPYELNCVYLDALCRPGVSEPVAVEIDRFVAAHSILLAMAGVPALYVHSLLGSRNWVAGVERTGQPRTINRERLTRESLDARLADRSALRRRVLDRLRARIATRTTEPAFHPSAGQLPVAASPEHFAVQRVPGDGPPVVCVHDVSGRPGRFRARPPDRLPGGVRIVDLCDGSEHATEADGTVDVAVPAYGVRWLRVAP